MSKSLVKNVLAKGTLNIFNIIVPLLIFPYIYRVLSPSIVGKIDYSYTLFTYFSLAGLLGIYNYGLREISRKRDSIKCVNSIYKNLFVIGLISNSIVYILYSIFVFFFIKDPILKKIMYVQGLAIIGQILYIEWMNEAYEDFRFITIKTMIIRLISILCIFLFVNDDSDYLVYVLITVLTLFFNNIVSFAHIRKYVDISVFALFKDLDLKPLILPLLLVLILNNTNLLYTIADKTMIGAYLTDSDVAFYTVGQKITEIVRILFLSLVYVTIPKMSYYLENNYTLYKDSIRKLMRVTVLIIAPVAFGLLALSDDIVMLFSGSGYEKAIPAMRVFSLRVLVLSTESIVYNQIIFLHRKEKFLLLANFMCGLLSVALNFVFLKMLTPAIAIFTTVMCEILFQAICYVYIKRKLKISTGLFELYSLKYLLLSASFLPIVYCVKMVCFSYVEVTFVSIPLCMLLYGLMLFLLKDNMTISLFNRLMLKVRSC